MIDMSFLPDVAYWCNGTISSEPPVRYRKAGFNTWPTRATFPEVADQVAKYAETFSATPACGGQGGLKISAPEGAGSTYLSMSLTASLAKRGFRVIYVSSNDFLTAALANDGSNATNIINMVNRYDLVVLDDFGIRPAMVVEEDVVAATLFRLIDSRYINCRPVVIATILPLDTITQNGFGVTQRITDRIEGDRCSFGWTEVSHG